MFLEIGGLRFGGGGFVCLFLPHHTACGFLVLQPGIEPVPPAVEVWSLNHWTTKESQDFVFLR